MAEAREHDEKRARHNQGIEEEPAMTARAEEVGEDQEEEPRYRPRRHRGEAPSLGEVAEAYFERACDVIPADFVRHMRAARKELYLAIRSLIDARLEALEEAQERSESRRPKRVRIE